MSTPINNATDSAPEKLNMVLDTTESTTPETTEKVAKTTKKKTVDETKKAKEVIEITGDEVIPEKAESKDKPKDTSTEDTKAKDYEDVINKLKPSKIIEEPEAGELILSFYQDPETDQVMKHYNKLCKKENFKTVKLTNHADFSKWWDWINDCTRFCGLNDICTKLLQNATKPNARKIKCKEDEEYLVKKLINNSVPDMGYDMKSLTNAQDWLLEAVSLAGMKVSATVLQKDTHEFNLDNNKSKQQLLKEWKIINMKHDIMGTEPAENEIIDRFITYVKIVVKDTDLKNELIQINNENGA